MPFHSGEFPDRRDDLFHASQCVPHRLDDPSPRSDHGRPWMRRGCRPSSPYGKISARAEVPERGRPRPRWNSSWTEPGVGESQNRLSVYGEVSRLRPDPYSLTDRTGANQPGGAAHHGTTSFSEDWRLSASCGLSTPRCRWIPPGVPRRDLCHCRRRLRGESQRSSCSRSAAACRSCSNRHNLSTSSRNVPVNESPCLSQPQPRCRFEQDTRNRCQICRLAIPSG